MTLLPRILVRLPRLEHLVRLATHEALDTLGLAALATTLAALAALAAALALRPRAVAHVIARAGAHFLADGLARERLDRTLPPLLLAEGLHLQHPVRHVTARRLHHVGDRAELLNVVFREESDRAAGAPRAARATNPVDVRRGALREVVVDHEGDALEVHAARHQLGRDEDPHLARAELVDGRIALRRRALGVYDVDVDAVVHELVEELHRALLALDEDEHGRLDALPNHLSQRQQLAVFAPTEDELLLDDLGRRILLAHHDAHREAKHGAREVLYGGLHGGREESTLDVGRRARGEHFVDLFEEAELEQLICLVEHERLHLAQLDCAALEHRHEAEGRADEDVVTAEDVALAFGRARRARQLFRQHARAQPRTGRQLDHLAVRLARELLRRRDRDRAHTLAARPVEPREHRDEEGGRLARARRRARQHLAPRQQHRHRLHLHAR
mmetsp:Transcript_52738/g.138675  ORF Transcript_52738/g.138675 Transcript_52738/m.138675 type:complete len:445 (-) Transcript_52738:148-1482(-)